MLDRLQIFFIAFGLLFFVGSAQASDLKLSESDWHKTFEKAGTYVDNTKNECAKFVNRLFALRFGTTIWGNAWDIPLNNSNQKFLKLKWTFDDAVINPKTNSKTFTKMVGIVSEENPKKKSMLKKIKTY